MNFRSLTTSFCTALFLGVPALLNACTVCFGGQNSSWSKGYYWGILLLLALPPVLFLAIAGKIVLAIRKKSSDPKEILPFQ